jgi:hypothetical protein
MLGGDSHGHSHGNGQKCNHSHGGGGGDGGGGGSTTAAAHNNRLNVGFGDDDDAYARPAKPNPMMQMMKSAMMNMQQQMQNSGAAGSGASASMLPNNPMLMGGPGGGMMTMPQMTPEMMEFAKKMFEQRQELMRDFVAKGGNSNPEAVRELMQRSSQMQQTAMAEMKRLQSAGSTAGASSPNLLGESKPALMTPPPPPPANSSEAAAKHSSLLPSTPSLPALAHPAVKSSIDGLLRKSPADEAKDAREDEEKRILAAIEAKDYSQLSVVKATQYGVLERVRELIEKHGYDPNKPDDENVYLLHWAAINNRMEIAEYLLKVGALVDPIGGELESSPLNWAARSGHVNMVALLMRHGANPLLSDIEGFSTIHLATMFSHSNVVAYFLVKGVDVSDVVLLTNSFIRLIIQIGNDFFVSLDLK